MPCQPPTGVLIEKGGASLVPAISRRPASPCARALAADAIVARPSATTMQALWKPMAPLTIPVSVAREVASDSRREVA